MSRPSSSGLLVATSTPADEMTMARNWLTHLRESAVYKIEGLDNTQLRWKPASTANSLGQIVVHLGYAERLWLRAIVAGEPMDTHARIRAARRLVGRRCRHEFYRTETAAADVLDAAASFDEPCQVNSARRPCGGRSST
jgi:uncharacterized damage-inducible protein DinB